MLSKSQNYEVSPKKIQINFILSTILKIRKVSIKYIWDIGVWGVSCAGVNWIWGVALVRSG